jgi:hypothetical protein
MPGRGYTSSSLMMNKQLKGYRYFRYFSRTETPPRQFVNPTHCQIWESIPPSNPASNSVSEDSKIKVELEISFKEVPTYLDNGSKPFQDG